MGSSDVSSVVKYFSTAAEGFNTTLSSTISASATSVGLNSTSGLTNGAVFVGIIEPGATAQQTFTGTVDISGSQITNVVWVRGANVGHAGGVTIVDYVSGAAHNMTTAGILKQHTQAGVHTGITTDTLVASGVATLNGGTTLPAGDIATADIAAAAVTDAKLVYGKVRSRQGGSATNWQTVGTNTYDYSATNTFIQVGSVTGAIGGSDATVTFPTAFSQVPLVFVLCQTANSVNANKFATNNVTTTGCKIRSADDASAEAVGWLAIGQ